MLQLAKFIMIDPYFRTAIDKEYFASVQPPVIPSPTPSINSDRISDQQYLTTDISNLSSPLGGINAVGELSPNDAPDYLSMPGDGDVSPPVDSNGPTTRKRRRTQEGDIEVNEEIFSRQWCNPAFASPSLNFEHRQSEQEHEFSSAGNAGSMVMQFPPHEERVDACLSQPGNEPPVPPRSRKTRGPGKAQLPQAPRYEGNSDFAENCDGLRRQIHAYKVVDGLRVAWEFIDGFRCDSVDPVEIDPSHTKVQQLLSRIRHCNKFEKNDRMKTRGTVERRFWIVQLDMEYERMEAAKAGSNALQSFRREVEKELKVKWGWHRQKSQPLRKAVDSYGWGVLVYPLKATNPARYVPCLPRQLGITLNASDRNAERYSLQSVTRQLDMAFLGYLEETLPGLKGMLQNLSYVMPKLMFGDLPADEVKIIDESFEITATFGNESFNRLVQLPAQVSDSTQLDPFVGFGCQVSRPTLDCSPDLYVLDCIDIQDRPPTRERVDFI